MTVSRSVNMQVRASLSCFKWSVQIMRNLYITINDFEYVSFCITDYTLLGKEFFRLRKYVAHLRGLCDKNNDYLSLQNDNVK